MAILNPINEKKLRHVGFQLPSHVYAFLAAYALSKGKTKSAVLKDMLAQLFSQMSANELEPLILKRIEDKWNEIKHSGRMSELNAFQAKIEKELLAKSIPGEMIQNILQDFLIHTHGANKNKNNPIKKNNARS